MKIYHRNKIYYDPPEIHGVYNKTWINENGSYTNKYLEYQITTFCKQTFILRKGDGYEEYSKDKHLKTFCKTCLHAIRTLQSSKKNI